jgi:hypothetical protein
MDSKKVAILSLTAVALMVAPSISWWGFDVSSQEAKAVVRSVTGSGTGTHSCPNGSAKTSSIAFSASTSGGSWTIPGKTGPITSISSDGKSLTGKVTLDVLCFGKGTGASVTISTQCGPGVSINFQESTGARGMFKGNVSCK